MRQPRSICGLLVVAVAFVLVGPAEGDQSSCSSCPAWNVRQPPFPIYGNTYFVGVRGLSSILIASSEGHVLIDGDLPESTANIVSSMGALGYRIEDVKIIANSHAHFDHAGGIAELQRVSGATVVASESGAAVLKRGGVGRDDPQYGALVPIRPVAQVQAVKDGETLHVGPIALTAHLTPGHTPGGTSWTWTSCERAGCLNVVFADSLTAVSADGFLFTRSREYPHVLEDFQRSFATLSALPCDILVTTHPEAAGLWDKLQKRTQGESNAFVDTSACRGYVNAAREGLAKRVAEERR